MNKQEQMEYWSQVAADAERARVYAEQQLAILGNMVLDALPQPEPEVRHDR